MRQTYYMEHRSWSIFHELGCQAAGGAPEDRRHGAAEPTQLVMMIMIIAIVIKMIIVIIIMIIKEPLCLAMARSAGPWSPGFIKRRWVPPGGARQHPACPPRGREKAASRQTFGAKQTPTEQKQPL